MSNSFIGENDPNFSDDMAKKAEEASSRSRDRIDGMTDEAKDIADHTYKNADDVANDPRVSAHEAKKKIKEKKVDALSNQVRCLVFSFDIRYICLIHGFFWIPGFVSVR